MPADSPRRCPLPVASHPVAHTFSFYTLHRHLIVFTADFIDALLPAVHCRVQCYAEMKFQMIAKIKQVDTG